MKDIKKYVNNQAHYVITNMNTEIYAYLLINGFHARLCMETMLVDTKKVPPETPYRASDLWISLCMQVFVHQQRTT